MAIGQAATVGFSAGALAALAAVALAPPPPPPMLTRRPVRGPRAGIACFAVALLFLLVLLTGRQGYSRL